MDETGQAGDAGAANSGAGADPRDRALTNGWATSAGPWSSAGAALDPASDVPAWRSPSTEIRPFTLDALSRERADPADLRSANGYASGSYANGGFTNGAYPNGARPNGRSAADTGSFGRNGSSGESNGSTGTGAPDGLGTLPEPGAPRWGQSRSRYSDLVAHLSPSAADGDPRAPDPRASDPRASDLRASDPRASDLRASDLRAPDLRAPDLRAPGPSRAGDPLGVDDLLAAGDGARTTAELPPRPVSAARFPSSAPPLPYESDLDGTRSRGGAAQPSNQAAFPAVRPSVPGGHSVDRAAESARHSLGQQPPVGGGAQSGQLPSGHGPPGQDSSGQMQPGQMQPGQMQVGAAGADERLGDTGRPRYDPDNFPRRLPYEPPRPRSGADPVDLGGYVPPPAYANYPPANAEPPSRVAPSLPQRVPAQPDVPIVPDPPPRELAAGTPALARIATHLRRGDVFSPRERQDGFDVPAILAAVREVEGVRDASVRTTPAGANSLRLDLSEGADPAEVSRRVARLLQDRMGLDAAVTAPGGAFGAPSAAPQATPSVAPYSSPPVAQYSSPPASPFSSPPASPFSSPPVSPYSSPPAAPRSGPVGGGFTEPTYPPANAGYAGQNYSGPPDSGVTPGGGSASVPPQPPPTGRASVGSGAAMGPETTDASGAGMTGARGMGTDASEARRLPPQPRQRSTFDGRSTSDGRSPSDGRFPGEVSGATVFQPGAAARLPPDFEPAPPRPLYPNDRPGPRVVIDNVLVNTFGIEATVEVRLVAGDRAASGVATGPAVDGYLLRLCASATAGAVDDLLSSSSHVDAPARCYVEHAASVPFGVSQVAVVVLLLACGGWVEQLAGSAVITGDDAHAMVRATLAAVNRRLEALLS